jgi:hypothetical protein
MTSYATERFEAVQDCGRDRPCSDLTNEQLRQAIMRCIQRHGERPEAIEDEMQELLDELCARLK